MKKEKVVYRFFRYKGSAIKAKQEIPYEIRIYSRLLLDELCFNWNKKQLEEGINSSIDGNNKQSFMDLSEKYKQYIWE